MSAFDKWFLAQFGPRESRSQFKKDDDDALRDFIIRGELAADELRRRQAWDARRTAALYAWNANEWRGTDGDTGE